jgi:hypothetical protein
MLVGVALTAAAGGVSAYGQYRQGKSQDQYYRYLADQNEREAEAARITAEQEAELAKQTGDLRSTIGQNEAAQRAKELKGNVSTVKGAQRAAMAAMGIYGVTAEDILTDTTNKAKLDEANIRYNADINSWEAKRNADLEAWSARKGAADKGWALGNQASAYRLAGKQARSAAKINMVSSILGTAASITGGLSRLKPTMPTTGVNMSNIKYPEGIRASTGGYWSPYKL